ncbi:MAG: hypothetical protein ABW321_35500, partial [Polyangiales bacterium]
EQVPRLIDLVLRVDAATAAARPGDLLDLARELADDDQLDLLLQALSLLYRDVAQVALRGDAAALSFAEQRALLAERAQTLGALQSAERVAAIAATQEAIERNANAEIALDALLFGFATGRLEPLRLVVRQPRRA